MVQSAEPNRPKDCLKNLSTRRNPSDVGSVDGLLKQSLRVNLLAEKVSRLVGVGEKTIEILHKSNILNVFDLLLHVPKSLVLQSEAPGFLHMEAGRTYVATGKVFAVKSGGLHQKRRFEAIIQDDTGRMTAVFFGPAVSFAQQILKKDAEVTLVGQARDFLGRIQMVHPKILTNKGPAVEAKVATYSQLGGLNSAAFKRIVDKALAQLKRHETKDHLSPEFIAEHNLSPLSQALQEIHNPKEIDEHSWDNRGQSPLYRRLAMEEILSFYVRLYHERGHERHQPSIGISQVPLNHLIQDFLPFTLTNAQRRACEEILLDLQGHVAMTRLVQGDVGSGKTAVSAIAALQVASAQLQVAIMAPTEILAEQLFKVFQGFFAQKPIKIALLTANVKGKERKCLAENIAKNHIAIVVGTHALLSEDIQFNKLGLLVIDEQHRFGVKQRAELLNGCLKNQGFTPHLLVMSATPIPRSLALTFYGDLDLSVIDERPQGRQPVQTQVLTGPVLENIERVAARIVDTKQKAFIVFPLIEESENLDLENATKAVVMLKRKFGETSSMLLHGKMKPGEKLQAMEAFRASSISFLVATTVVEVGIDIPDATCMVIAHPERFGLAQLHQLRGRVGRKDLKSYCLLVTDIANRSAPAYKRLSAMCTTDNGFKLAEIDLKIRGPGELLGTKQSGLPNFLIFNHSDFADLVLPAKIMAKALHKNGLRPEHLHLLGNATAHFS